MTGTWTQLNQDAEYRVIEVTPRRIILEVYTGTPQPLRSGDRVEVRKVGS